MQTTSKKRFWKRLAFGLAIYYLLCIFAGGFLLVDARSHNRLFREQVPAARLVVKEEQAILQLATYTLPISITTPSEPICFLLSTLPGISGNAAVLFIQHLWNP